MDNFITQDRNEDFEGGQDETTFSRVTSPVAQNQPKVSTFFRKIQSSEKCAFFTRIENLFLAHFFSKGFSIYRLIGLL